jgi:hypothetical protein
MKALREKLTFGHESRLKEQCFTFLRVYCYWCFLHSPDSPRLYSLLVHKRFVCRFKKELEFFQSASKLRTTDRNVDVNHYGSILDRIRVYLLIRKTVVDKKYV